jgi:hypothetical protein
MDTISNILLPLACISLVFVYYFGTFKQLMKTPILFFLYVMIWLLILVSSSIIIDKTYFKKAEKPRENSEKKEFLKI